MPITTLTTDYLSEQGLQRGFYPEAGQHSHDGGDTLPIYWLQRSLNAICSVSDLFLTLVCLGYIVGGEFIALL